MFDKLKLVCLITMAYAEMGIENARISIHQYFYPVSTMQQIVDNNYIDQDSAPQLIDVQLEEDLQEVEEIKEEFLN